MGHKTKQKLKLEERSTGKRITNISAPARNLRTTDLGSVIFGCKNSTFRECIFKQLFGLPSHHYAYVRNVKPGMPLFLFNYSDRRLHGIFEAESNGQMNINPYAWTFDSIEPTSFPAQVRVRVRQQCRSLTEDQFKPIIHKNYYERSLFWFELDKVQTHNLIASFLASPITQTSSMLQTPLQDTAFSGPSNSFTRTPEMNAIAWNSKEGQTSSSEFQGDDSLVRKFQDLVCQEPLQKQDQLPTSFPKKSWSSLFTVSRESKANEEEEMDLSLT